jgi:nucleoside-diphosphate-sugar epimerase
MRLPLEAGGNYICGMKVLVTGGAGFIGSHVCRRLLSEGHEVVVIDDFNDFYDPAIKRANIAALGSGVLNCEGDIRDRDFVWQVFAGGRFDAIIHLAARAGVRPSLKNPQLYIDTNITGTHNLLEAARTLGVSRKPDGVAAAVQRIRDASGGEVYGDTLHVGDFGSLAGAVALLWHWDIGAKALGYALLQCVVPLYWLSARLSEKHHEKVSHF